MPAQTPTAAPKLRRYMVCVPAAYWNREDGLVDGYGYQQETRAYTEREAIDAVMETLLPRLLRTQEHFQTFEVVVARVSPNPARRTVGHYKVARSGRVIRRELRPWFD